MAKFIEIETTDKLLVTINVEQILAIFPDGKQTVIKLTSPNVVGFYIKQPYDEFMKWFYKQLPENNDWDEKYME